MKPFLFFTFLLIFFSCKSQENFKKASLDNTDYKVLEVFLNQMKISSYTEKHLFNRNFIKLFNGKYRQHKKTFKTSDSICKYSKDTLKLRIFCPLADTFKYYENILSEEDLNFLIKKYDKEEDIQIIDLKQISERTLILEHSNFYYDNIDYKKYGRIPDYKSISNFNEFPSIHIENIYYNKEKDVAIVAYSIADPLTHEAVNFFILKQIKKIWWKPLGAFKF
jgi:hypothetical protein